MANADSSCSRRWGSFNGPLYRNNRPSLRASNAARGTVDFRGGLDDFLIKAVVVSPR